MSHTDCNDQRPDFVDETTTFWRINLETDLILSKQLPFSAMKAADAYREIALNTYHHPTPGLNNGERVAPCVSLLGLTCEIYLKSLLYSEQDGKERSFVRGHNLCVLFQTLSESTRNTIVAQYTQKGGAVDFSAELSRIATAFEVYRYVYELGAYVANIGFLLKLVDVLHDIVHERLNTE